MGEHGEHQATGLTQGRRGEARDKRTEQERNSCDRSIEGSAHTGSDVWRNLVGAAVTKTCSASPGPASRRRARIDRAQFLARLVVRLAESLRCVAYSGWSPQLEPIALGSPARTRTADRGSSVCDE